ncbi:MAG: NTP transferase domain-containing protein [Candidatus Solibacter usitatus]|nr:NTP transferase domain-containing protein [Candidatus Solibacter usitatus]
MTGVIAAAGKGNRAYPYTRLIPKAMIDVCGQPVLHYTIAVMRDQLGIRDVIIVVGPHGGPIREYFGNGERHGVRIRYAQNDQVDKGLAYSVLRARDLVAGSHFVLMLSDELYWNSNHQNLLAIGYESADAILAVRGQSTNREIRKNFSVVVDGDRVRALVEKPVSSSNGLLGCGTYVFSTGIFAAIERRFEEAKATAGDLTAAINDLIASGRTVRHFALDAEYVNINYQEDIHQARSIVRRAQLPGARVSLVMPCESELSVIEDMLRLARRRPRITELLLVSRQENAALEQLVRTYGARLVVKPALSRGSFGGLFRAGIAEASGDIIAITMDDDSFDLGDLDKLLAYLCDADLVLGTRTTSQLVQQGSNLNWAARAANWMLAKIIELLWFRRQVRLTDAACTFRAFWRDTWEQIEPGITADGPEFAPEMIVEALRRRMWVLEIPINYCRSSEESRIRVEHRRPRVFLAMLRMILRKRLWR